MAQANKNTQRSFIMLDVFPLGTWNGNEKKQLLCKSMDDDDYDDDETTVI